MRVSAATTGLPGRYASALFDLATQSDSLQTVDADLKRLQQALQESAEFTQLINSPVISREAASRALAALQTELGLQDLTARFLGVIASNGRLGILPAVISRFDTMLNAHKGTAIADVQAAHALSDEQTKALSAKLKARTGQDIALNISIDPDLIGGLVVRIGSEQIDSSIRTRLHRLGQQMKG